MAGKLSQFGQTISYWGSSFVRITLPTVFKLEYFSFLDLLFTYWSGDEHSTWILIFEYLRKKKCFGPNVVPLCWILYLSVCWYNIHLKIYLNGYYLNLNTNIFKAKFSYLLRNHLFEIFCFDLRKRQRPTNNKTNFPV